jgi:hypothetical protein
MPKKKDSKGKAPARKLAGPKRERVTPSGLRTLADVETRGKPKPRRKGPKAALAEKARAKLEKEFEAALALKKKLRNEAQVGGDEKGREALRQTEKLRSIVMSLEGMNRFALGMGLITPAESRQLYADAMKRGLYEGWR